MVHEQTLARASDTPHTPHAALNPTSSPYTDWQPLSRPALAALVHAVCAVDCVGRAAHVADCTRDTP